MQTKSLESKYRRWPIVWYIIVWLLYTYNGACKAALSLQQSVTESKKDNQT